MSTKIKWAAVCVLGGIIATGAVATSLAAGDSLQACAKTEGGQLRLVTDSSDCLPSETAIAWSATSGTGTTFTTVSDTVPATGLTTATATCPADGRVVGGGGHASPVAGGNVIATYPATQASWTVTAVTNPTATSVTVYAVCAA
jgi:hypothetical protein